MLVLHSHFIVRFNLIGGCSIYDLITIQNWLTFYWVTGNPVQVRLHTIFAKKDKSKAVSG